MALQNFQYDIIMREYSRRQSQVQHDLEERRKEAFVRVPRLLEIDQEVAALSARKARSLLLGESDTVEDLKKDVAALAQEHGVEELVLGHPINMDGTRGPRSEKAQAMKVLLEETSSLPVILWDERRTTIDAHNILFSAGKNATASIAFNSGS